MSVDPGLVAPVATVLGAFIAAMAAFFKSKENGNKLSEIHVLVDGNYSELQRQVKAAEEHNKRLEDRMDQLLASTQLATRTLAETTEANKLAAAMLAERARISALDTSEARIAAMEKIAGDHPEGG